MKRFIWFVIFNFIGIFLISYAFPEMSTKHLLALILGIQFISTSLDFLDHLDKKEE